METNDSSPTQAFAAADSAEHEPVQQVSPEDAAKYLEWLTTKVSWDTFSQEVREYIREKADDLVQSECPPELAQVIDDIDDQHGVTCEHWYVAFKAVFEDLQPIATLDAQS
jgi:hypothetical protein